MSETGIDPKTLKWGEHLMLRTIVTRTVDEEEGEDVEATILLPDGTTLFVDNLIAPHLHRSPQAQDEPEAAEDALEPHPDPDSLKYKLGDRVCVSQGIHSHPGFIVGGVHRGDRPYFVRSIGHPRMWFMASDSDLLPDEDKPEGVKPKATASGFTEGQRVRVTSDSPWYSAGDTGIVKKRHGIQAKVQFDEGCSHGDRLWWVDFDRLELLPLEPAPAPPPPPASPDPSKPFAVGDPVALVKDGKRHGGFVISDEDDSDVPFAISSPCWDEECWWVTPDELAHDTPQTEVEPSPFKFRMGEVVTASDGVITGGTIIRRSQDLDGARYEVNQDDLYVWFSESRLRRATDAD